MAEFLEMAEKNEGCVNYTGSDSFGMFVRRVTSAHIGKIGITVTIAESSGFDTIEIGKSYGLDVKGMQRMYKEHGLEHGKKMTFVELGEIVEKMIPKQKYRTAATAKKACIMWDLLSDEDRQRAISTKV